VMRYGSVCSGIEAATCTKCGIEKPGDAFHKQGHRRHSWCKECFNANARAVRNRKVTPEQRAKHNLWTRYRLRPDEVQEMLAEQGGVCAICSQVPFRAVIDHDHQTGLVRGILCHGCNLKLPAIEDVLFAAAALTYLGRKR
jgi:hypothetical protein